MSIKITERGWGGHYILANRCLFRRNTLIEHFTLQTIRRIVVSTVGHLVTNDQVEHIAAGRYYETMAFHAELDGIYWDADVKRRIPTSLTWQVKTLSEVSDQVANDMHDAIVADICKKIGEVA